MRHDWKFLREKDTDTQKKMLLPVLVIPLVVIVLMIVIVNCGQAQAAEKTATKDITFEELNDENVFIKQSRRGTCTLASSAMIMRRKKQIENLKRRQRLRRKTETRTQRKTLPMIVFRRS